MQPGRRLWPRAFNTGGSIEAYVPEARFGTLKVRLYRGMGDGRGLTFHMSRVEAPDRSDEGPESNRRRPRAT